MSGDNTAAGARTTQNSPIRPTETSKEQAQSSVGYNGGKELDNLLNKVQQIRTKRKKTSDKDIILAFRQKSKKKEEASRLQSSQNPYLQKSSLSHSKLKIESKILRGK